jgi:hypothetical protein
MMTRCREAAGQENVGLSANRLFVSDAELIRMIDAAMRALYDLLVQARGHEYYAATCSTAPGAPIALVGPTIVRGQYGYDLPADWYKTIAVRAQFGPSDYLRDVEPYNPGEAAALRNNQASGGIRQLRYRHGGSYATDADPVHRDRLLLVPTPTSTVTVEVDYLPTYLTTTSAVGYNGVQGWEDYAIYSVVADMLAKEESDPSYWLARKGETEARIRDLAGERDMGRPQYIQCREPLDARGYGRFRRGDF